MRETAERYENVTHQIEVLHELLLHLRNHVKKISQDEKERDQLPSGISALEEFAQEQDNSLQVKIKMELLSLREQKFQETAIRRLREYILAAKKEHLRSAENGFKRICKYFEEEAARRENLVQKMHRELQSAFSFIKESLRRGNTGDMRVWGDTGRYPDLCAGILETTEKIPFADIMIPEGSVPVAK